MRVTKQEYANILKVWPDQFAHSYDRAEKIVFGWVKQDRISPKQMSELLIIAYKQFVY